jgi:hypothetical protein
MSDFHINIVQLFLLFFFLRLFRRKRAQKISHPRNRKLFLCFSSFFIAKKKGFHFLYVFTTHQTKIKNIFAEYMYDEFRVSAAACHGLIFSFSLCFQLYFISESLDCVCGRCLTEFFHFHFPHFTHV